MSDTRNHRRRILSTPSEPGHQAPNPAPSAHQEPADSPSSSSSSSSAWDMIEVNPPETCNTSTPTFPEWNAALQSASSALSTVTTASNTLAATLSRSGLSHASRTIATSATKSAASLANWAVARSGADASEHQPKRRAVEVGGGSGVMRRTDPLTFGDERGAFVLDTRYVDDGQSLLGMRAKGKRRASLPAEPNEAAYSSGTTGASADRVDDGDTEEGSFIGYTKPSDAKRNTPVRATMPARDVGKWIPAVTGFDVRNSKGEDKGSDSRKGT